MRPYVLAASAVLAACAAQHTPAPTQSADARADRVLHGLRPKIAIQGEPPVRWTLAERMQHYHVPGVSIAVIDSGRIVWAKGFGVKTAGGTDSVTPTTIFEAGSISKPTFALGVMRLVQDGTLNLDANVNDKLTSWKVPDNKFTVQEKVTLRRILSHNAGLTIHGFPGYEAGTPVPTVPQVLDGLPPANTKAVRVDTFPGAISRYSGGGTTIAMLLVTDVIHEPFPQFMHDSVLGPAGMIHSTYEQPLPASRAADASTGHDENGAAIPGKYHTYPEMSAAGLWTTPSDLATLGIELQRTYAGQDSAVVKPATFKQMLTIQKAPFGIGYIVNGAGPTLEFSHDGDDAGFVASFIVFPARGQGVAIMTNGQNGGSVIGELEASIAAEYQWPDRQQTVRSTVPVDPKLLASYAGSYRLTSDTTAHINVTVDGTHLVAAVLLKGVQIDRSDLYADTDTSFFDTEEGTPVTFSRNGLTFAGTYKAVRIK